MASTKLLGIYSDGMVLQRNAEIIVEGIESDRSEVQVRLGGATVTAKVADGKFKAIFPPMEAAVDIELVVEGSGKVTVKDVCIGDVYMLTGQSNMELPVARTFDLNREEIEAEDYPYIRQYRLTPDLEIPIRGEDPVNALPEFNWVKASGTGKNEISAVGFYAAKRIYAEKNVPIGLVLSAQGGSNIESWMCEEDLYETGTSEDSIAPFRGAGALKAYVAEGNQKTCTWRENTVDKDFDLEAAMASAQTVELPGIVMTDFSGSVWFRKEFYVDKVTEGKCLLRLGDLIDADVTYVNGVEVGRTEYQYPPRKYSFDASILKPGKNTVTTRLIIENNAGGFVPGHPYRLETSAGDIDMSGEWKMAVEKKTERFMPNMMAQNIPSALYYASLLTMRNYKVSQIWWYQGESNAEDPAGYDKKMILTFRKMRELFGDLPLILIRIADYINPLTFATEVPEGWRGIQRLIDEAPEHIADVKVVRASVPDPIYELHPQNKSCIGADVAKASTEF